MKFLEIIEKFKLLFTLRKKIIKNANNVILESRCNNRDLTPAQIKRLSAVLEQNELAN